MDLFGRVIQLQVGGKTVPSILTVYFDIPFDDTEDVNTANIKIYNLSDKTIRGIKNNSSISLFAGYETDIGLIFNGKVKSSETYWSGSDKITEINGIDDVGNYLNKKVVKTFAPGTSASTVLSYLIGEAKLGIGELNPVDNFVYRNGKTLKGTIPTLLKSIVKDTKSKMHINRKRIYIRDPKKGDATGFVIDKESGLIDSPEKIEIEDVGKDDGNKKTEIGWQVNTLLNHKVTVDTIFQLKTKSVNGQFRVRKGRHRCDGSAYYTESEVF